MLSVAFELSWLLMITIAMIGVRFLKDLTNSIDRLTISIGTVISRIDNHEVRLNNHETRLKDLEK